jgi:hypothetical protein
MPNIIMASKMIIMKAVSDLYLALDSLMLMIIRQLANWVAIILYPDIEYIN